MQVQGFLFGIWGSGTGSRGSEFRVRGFEVLGCRGSWFPVQGFGVRRWGFRVRDFRGFGVTVTGCRGSWFRVHVFRVQCFAVLGLPYVVSLFGVTGTGCRGSWFRGSGFSRFGVYRTVFRGPGFPVR